MKTNIRQLVKKEIKKIDKNAEIILFGSRARGDYKKHSDWDFLILLNKIELIKYQIERAEESFEDASNLINDINSLLNK